MKPVLRTIKATLVGGIFFILPLTVIILILGKSFKMAHQIIYPIATRLTISKIAGIETARLMAILLIIILCLLFGFIARTHAVKRGVTWMEDKFLSKFPGYIMLKSISQSALGVESRHEFEPIVAHIEETWQLGFCVEKLDDSRVVVFLPGAPNADSGPVLVLEGDKVQRLNIPADMVRKLIRHIGVGTKDILESKGEKIN